MEIPKYLGRIGYAGDTRPTIELLNSIQRRHLLSVPFENLDIHYKIPIELNLQKIFEKVVIDKRGGFCYELNGLFNDLLNALGFEVKMISALVFSQQQQAFTPEFDHLALVVKIKEWEYLVDVGFGEFAFSPLKLELNTIQVDERGSFRIERSDDVYYKVVKEVDKKWVPEYMFTLKNRDLAEFKERCDYNQTSPLSHFTQNKFCSLPTEKGRITVTANKIKITEADKITEWQLHNEEEFLVALEKYFHIRPDVRPPHLISA